MGWLKPVNAPDIVAVGAALPVAPGAYTVMLAPWKLATYKIPVGPTNTPSGSVRVVLAPTMLRIGATLPDALAANTLIVFTANIDT
jgi:hypothetical protein